MLQTDRQGRTRRRDTASHQWMAYIAEKGCGGFRARRTLNVIRIPEEPKAQSTVRHLHTSHFESENRVVYATCSTLGTGRRAEGSSRLMRCTTGLKIFINQRTGQLSPLTASMALNEVTKALSGSMPHNPCWASQLLMKFPAFYETRRFITVFTIAHTSYMVLMVTIM